MARQTTTGKSTRKSSSGKGGATGGKGNAAKPRGSSTRTSGGAKKSAERKPARSGGLQTDGADAPQSGKGSFPIVAIGASAGGLEAYEQFFKVLPSDTGMAFVLVQHLDPTHQSMLAEILARIAKIPVEEVKSGVVIRANCAYVIPPNTLMSLENCVFRLSPRGTRPGEHMPINFFMRSLAREEGSRAIGVILSGTGSDGTLGLEDVKAEGGITFAQDPGTARYDGMPRSAIDSGAADFMLSPREIAKELRRIRNHPYIRLQPVQESESDPEAEPSAEPEAEPAPEPRREPEAHAPGSRREAEAIDVGRRVRGRELALSVAPATSQKDFAAILDQLRKSSGADFSQYKPNTIHRRALRRMVVLKLDSLREYARYLEGHPEETERLYEDVLIPVTSFFRDFESFEALKSQVYPAIVKDKASKGTIRNKCLLGCQLLIKGQGLVRRQSNR